MLLARQIKMPGDVVTAIGLGALLHDAGKAEIPERVWRKSEPLSQGERALVESHVGKGVEVAMRMDLPPAALAVIAQHHELADGTGYPKRLKGEQIAPAARVVAIVNTYDNLCNPADRSAGMTPHEALALMFSKRRGQYDPLALNTFIRTMGIYPPGTLVELSDARLGIVVSVNGSNPLKPTVLMHAPELPKDAAPLVDLTLETALAVKRTLRPSEVRAEVLEYLSPGARMTYFLNPNRGG
jgi:putative nucleotidyltransferase with HDIG domain